MTDRIREFLAARRPEGPCLVLDLDVVRDNYRTFARALPDTRVFYAVKANPAPEVLALLAELGSCFDTASVGEIEAVLAAGATPERISYGNTIKKERDIARAFELGVRLFAVDCEAEVEKIARVAPGSKVFCRILCDGAGAEWPLSRKFGCAPAMAPRVLEHAAPAGPSRLWRVVPRRLAAEQCRGVGPGAGLGRGDLPRDGRARHPSVDGQYGRRLPDQVPQARAAGAVLRQRDLPGAVASTSATACRRPSSSRAAAWSAMPA